MVQNKQRENSDAEPFVCRFANQRVRHQEENQDSHGNIGYDFQNLLRFHLSARIQNRQQLVLREFLAAAAGENRAVRDSFIVRIGGNDHIRKCHWQTDFLDKRRQRVDKSVCQLCFCLSGGINTPYIHGEAGKLRRGFGKHMAVKDGMDHRQPLPVVAICVCAELMFEHMCLKIRDLADWTFSHRC